VTAALEELDPADPTAVDAAVTVGRFGAWLDRIDVLAARLGAG
jgi:hypothetical protein